MSALKAHDISLNKKETLDKDAITLDKCYDISVFQSNVNL